MLVIFFCVFFGAEMLVNLPLVLVFVTAVSFVEKPRVASIAAMTSGILVDISYGRLIGGSSILFLIVALIFYAYRKRFSEGNLIFLSIVVLISLHIYRFVFTGRFQFYLLESIVSLPLVFLATYFFYRMRGEA